MNRWFFFNGIIFCIAAWAIITTNSFGSHTIVGGMGVVLILFNWTRHAVFTTIRDSTTRHQKIQFANLSKKVLPFHRWIGASAVILIMLHGWLIIDRHDFYWQYPKFTVGVLTGLTLVTVAALGWLRLYWPSGTKRKLHLYLAMLMVILMTVHLLL